MTDGVVRIRGRAETRSTAEMIERLVAAVPGVIGLQADLTWAIDDTHVEGRPGTRLPVDSLASFEAGAQEVLAFRSEQPI